jgi:hypothetical protein
VPTTLPYGGEFTSPAAFDDFFAKIPGGGAVWKSFDSVVDDVLTADDHVIARLTNTAVLKSTGKTLVFHNLWLFGVGAGRITSAQLYADTEPRPAAHPVDQRFARQEATSPWTFIGVAAPLRHPRSLSVILERVQIAP